ncbi:MAG: hypothetical protein IPM82_30980 [Saprospiraceae bacterium]|nr:hypothetical protein [Saprospiraceae bacterium]
MWQLSSSGSCGSVLDGITIGINNYKFTTLQLVPPFSAWPVSAFRRQVQLETAKSLGPGS